MKIDRPTRRLRSRQADSAEESCHASHTEPTCEPQPPDAAAVQPISIVVVDDHRFMRDLISAMLARQEGRYTVVAEKGDAATAIAACKELAPDLLILDINLPDTSGI